MSSAPRQLYLRRQGDLVQISDDRDVLEIDLGKRSVSDDKTPLSEGLACNADDADFALYSDR